MSNGLAWSHIFLPRKLPGRPRIHSPREILNAILYVLRSGYQWCVLPHDLSSMAHRLLLLQKMAHWRHLGENKPGDLRVLAGLFEEESLARRRDGG